MPKTIGIVIVPSTRYMMIPIVSLMNVINSSEPIPTLNNNLAAGAITCSPTHNTAKDCSTTYVNVNSMTIIRRNRTVIRQVSR